LHLHFRGRGRGDNQPFFRSRNAKTIGFCKGKGRRSGGGGTLRELQGKSELCVVCLGEKLGSWGAKRRGNALPMPNGRGANRGEGGGVRSGT